MIYKIGNVKDVDKIPNLTENVRSILLEKANILTTEYGEDRDVDNDYGGYILFATKGTALEEIKAVFDYKEYTPEFTETYEPDISATTYITSTEFGVVLIIHFDDAPDVIRNSISKEVN